MTTGYAAELLREALSGQDDRRRIPIPTRRGSAVNAMCGDEVALEIADDGARILDITCRTRGCVFTRASASLLARALTGGTLGEARSLGDELRRELAGAGDLPAAVAALAPVRVYPARIRCALLPWEALRSALAT